MDRLGASVYSVGPISPIPPKAPFMVDAAKLAALRERYADATGADGVNPEFRRVAETQFQGDRRKWPFMDPATFLGAPFRPNAAASGYADLDVALVGVPMDLGVTNRAGARLGPRAVRAVERIGPFEHVLRATPLSEARVADVGDVPMAKPLLARALPRGHRAHLRRDRRGWRAHARGRGRPLDLAADPQGARRASGRSAWSISTPIATRAGNTRGRSSTTAARSGRRCSHGVLDPERVIQIGIRGGAEYLWEFSYESGMTVIHAEEAVAMGMPAVIERARAVVGDGPTYVSFDVDSLDPGFAPGTGTPEVGGLQPREALQLLRGLMGLDIVGGDVVEVAPQYDATTNTAQAAAQVMFTLLCLMVQGAFDGTVISRAALPLSPGLREDATWPRSCTSPPSTSARSARPLSGSAAKPRRASTSNRWRSRSWATTSARRAPCSMA